MQLKRGFYPFYMENLCNSRKEVVKYCSKREGFYMNYSDINFITQFSEIYDQWLQLYTKQTNTALSVSLSTIAHEIKNPLSLMKATLQLMELDCSTKQLDKIQLLLREVDRLNLLVTDLLSLQKSNLCTLGPVNIPELLYEMQFLFNGILQEKQIQLSVYTKRKIPFIYGDEEKLKQVLINLIKNALEACNPGGKIILSARLHKPNQVQIRIQDTGIGFTESQQAELFRLFYTTKEEGTGIGLAIVKQILSAHGGTIHVKSRPQKGSTFILHLPVNHNTY